MFGGLGWEVDTDMPILEAIDEIILENYGHLHNIIADYTLNDRVFNTILTAIAWGDRRTHSAFKHARISNDSGNEAIDYLCKSGLIEREPSRELPPEREHPQQKLKKEIERHRISDKLHFTSPFLRFWFAFVSPRAKAICQGDYDAIMSRFKEREQNWSSLDFEKLSIELLKKSFVHDPIVEVGSYWDRLVEIDILAKTRSGKVIVCECKYTNTKINKSELAKLKAKCETAGVEPDIIALFAKRGFSNELEAHKEEGLKLYDLEDFRSLLDDLIENDLIEGLPLPF
ncbi:DUF234 domain-containing protein [Sulfurimonas sp. HSL3-7]|uniref:DUF234 domain-containing protein n=1 Tax=Sulfonitrofixus jiaomeiensis TaxID=3131938 RepID=UPI0031F817B3